MSLPDSLLADLKAAMREGDVERREAIRMLRAAILNEEIERQRELTEGEIHGVIIRLARRHQDSIEQFERGGRADLVAREKAQLEAISVYLPEQIGPDDIEQRARVAIAATGASGKSDVGKVMQRLSAELRGKADLGEVSRVVRELLGA